MAIISTQTVDEAGVQITTAAVAAEGGDKWDNNGNQQILLKNGSGGSVTITVTTQVTSFESSQYGDATKSNTTLAVAAGQLAILGPFNVSAYNDVDGYCNISYSATTSVEVAIFEIQ